MPGLEAGGEQAISDCYSCARSDVFMKRAAGRATTEPIELSTGRCRDRAECRFVRKRVTRKGINQIVTGVTRESLGTGLAADGGEGRSSEGRDGSGLRGRQQMNKSQQTNSQLGSRPVRADVEVGYLGWEEVIELEVPCRKSHPLL